MSALRAEEIPIASKLAARGAAGLEKGMTMPERAVRGALDLVNYYPALDAVLGTGDKYQQQNADWLKYFNDRDQQLDRETKALGDAGFAGDVVEGATRGVVELPTQLLGGAAGAARGAAIKGAAITAGLTGGLSQYAQDRGAGRDKAESAAYGATSGLITGLTTAAFGATGVESIFKKEGVQGVGRRILEVLKQTGFEGAEESVDQFQQDLLERVTRNPDKPISQSVREILLAGTIGSLMGGAATGAAQLAGAAGSSRADATPEVEPAIEPTTPTEAELTAGDRAQPVAQELPVKPKETVAVEPLKEAAPPPESKAPEVITEEKVASMSPEDQGNLGHGAGMEYGVTLTEGAVTRLEAGYKKAGKEMAAAVGDTMAAMKAARDAKTPEAKAEAEQAQKAGEQAQSAAFGRYNYFGGALQGATRGRHVAAAANYEGFAKKRAAEGRLIPEQVPDVSVAETPAPEVPKSYAPEMNVPEAVKIAETAGIRFDGQRPDQWSFTLLDGRKPETSITVKPGATLAEVQAKAEAARTSRGTEAQRAASAKAADQVVEEFLAAQKEGAKPAPSAAKEEVSGSESTPGMVELGAATPESFEPAKPFTTRNTVEQINKERKERGVPPLEEHEVFSNKQAVAEAAKILDETPDAAERIIGRLREKPETSLEPTERAIMAIHRAQLSNSYYKALKNWREHFEGDDFVRAAEEAQIVDSYNKTLTEFDSLVGEGGSGTAAGRSLQAIKIGIREDYSLDMLVAKAMKAKGGRLTVEEQAGVQKQHEVLNEKIRKLEEELAAEKGRTGPKDVQEVVTETVAKVRREKAADKSAGKVRDLEAEQKSVVDYLKDTFIEEGGITGEATSVRKLMELIVAREGITERLPLETRVHEILRDVDPALTREGAQDLMSGYGKSKRPSQVFPKPIVRDIVSQIQKVRKLLDFFKGEYPKATGLLRDPESQISRNWTKMVNEAKKAFKLEGPVDTAKSLKTALDAINTRLTNRLKDLRQEVATRQKIIRERSPSPYDAETIRLRKEIEEVQKAHAEIFGSEMTPAERLAAAEKSAERQIVELQRQIDSGEIFPKSRIAFGGTSPKLEAAKAKVAELKTQREFARESAQPRPEPEAKAVESRAKLLDRQIEAIEKQIADEAVFSKGKAAKEPSTEARIIARESKLTALKEQRQFIRERIQPRPEQAALELEQRAKALTKKIEEVERQMRDGDIFPKGKTLSTPEKNDLIRTREAELNALKEQRQWAREAAQPKLEPHAAFLLNYELRLRQRAASYLERAAKGEFEKPVKPPRELSADVLKAMAEVEKAKQVFGKQRYEYEQANRTKLRKVWDGIRQTGGAFVNIASSFDLSAPRQMFLAMLANSSRMITDPIRGTKLTFAPLGKMFQALKSEGRSEALEQWRKNRPNAISGADKMAGIEYTELHTTDFTKGEEFAHSILDDWAALPLKTGNVVKSTLTAPVKIGAKGVRMSNRAFITALNAQRAMLFDELLRVNFKDRAPTDVELKVTGNLVNIATGRGKLNPGVGKAGAAVLWSPKLFASRLQALTGQPLWGGGELAGSARARKIVAKEYARWIISGTVLAALSQMYDEKEPVESTSSDWGKMVRGNTRIDLWEGFQQFVVLEERLRKGKVTSVGGKARDISGGPTAPGFGSGEVIWNFFKGKARPDIAAVVRTAVAAIDYGKQPKDVRVTPGEALKSAIPVPLALRDVIEVMRDRGMKEGAIIQILETFGAGVNTYDEKPSK